MIMKSPSRLATDCFFPRHTNTGRAGWRSVASLWTCTWTLLWTSSVFASETNSSSLAIDPVTAKVVLDADTATQGYCESVQGVADADAALLLAPQLFGSTGLVNGGSVLTGDSAVSTSTTLRLTAGVRYDLIRLYRGLMLQARAQAECKRYRADATVRHWSNAITEIGEEEGYRAREEFVERALPQAETLLARQLDAFAQQLATQEDVYSTQVRFNALRSLKSSSEQKRSTLRPVPVLDGQEIDFPEVWGMVDEAERAAAAVEEYSARMREAQAWTVDFRGGYDQTFANQLKQVPAFGIFQVTYNLGGLFQGQANDRALDGAAADRAEGFVSLKARVNEVQQVLLQLEAALTSRLEESTWLEKDAHRRWLELQHAEGQRAQNYADYLWFEVVRHRAERIYLEKRVTGIAKVLGRSHFRPESGLGREVPERVPALAPSSAKSGRLTPIPFEDFIQTKGELQTAAAGRFFVDVPKMRAVTAHGKSEEVRLRFQYLGPTEEQSQLQSGKSRQQLGLKLRAENGCNLVYAMWRIAPESSIQVQLKRNPGMTTHLECGNGGYETIVPTQRAAAPTLHAGDGEHRLRALWQGKRLAIFADGMSVWEGELPESATSLHGPAGIRSDNVRWVGALETRRD